MRHFFANRSVNRLYAHSAIFLIAENIGWVFGPLFLLNLGYSIPAAIFLWASLFLLRLPLRYFYLRYPAFFGLKRGIVLGLCGYAGALAFLPFVRENPDLLGPFLIIYSIGMTFYWTGYHTLFGLVGDQAHRGKQVAMVNSLSLFFIAFVPYVSASIIEYIGYGALFALSAAMMLIAAAPVLLLETPVLADKRHHSPELRAACRWIGLYHTFTAMREYGHTFIWRIIVFTMLGNLMLFGTVMTVGLLILAVMQLFVGSLVDKGRGYGLLKIGAVLTFIQITLRGFFVATPSAMAASEGMTLGKYFMTQAEANYYNRGKDSSDYFYYIYWGEAAWDVGAVITLGSMAVLIQLGTPIIWMLGFGVIGLIGAFRVVYSLYQKPADIPHTGDALEIGPA